MKTTKLILVPLIVLSALQAWSLEKGTFQCVSTSCQAIGTPVHGDEQVQETCNDYKRFTFIVPQNYSADQIGAGTTIHHMEKTGWDLSQNGWWSVGSTGVTFKNMENTFQIWIPNDRTQPATGTLSGFYGGISFALMKLSCQ